MDAVDEVDPEGAEALGREREVVGLGQRRAARSASGERHRRGRARRDPEEERLRWRHDVKRQPGRVASSADPCRPNLPPPPRRERRPEPTPTQRHGRWDSRLPRALTLAAALALAAGAGGGHGAGSPGRGRRRRRRTTPHPCGRRAGPRSPTPTRHPTAPSRCTSIGADGGGRRQLTSGNLSYIDVAWSPSGKQIGFSGVTDGQVITAGHVYVENAAGGGLDPARRRGGGFYDELFGWSPDGTLARLRPDHQRPRRDLHDGAERHRPARADAQPGDDDYWAVWSPDGKQDRLRPHQPSPSAGRRHLGHERRRLRAAPAHEQPRRQLRLGLVARRQADRLHVEPQRPLPDLRHAARPAGAQQALTSASGGAGEPRWSPNGKEIAYEAQVDGSYQIFVMQANGSGQRQLTQGAPEHRPGLVAERQADRLPVDARRRHRHLHDERRRRRPAPGHLARGSPRHRVAPGLGASSGPSPTPVAQRRPDPLELELDDVARRRAAAPSASGARAISRSPGRSAGAARGVGDERLPAGGEAGRGRGAPRSSPLTRAASQPPRRTRRA